MTVPKVVKVSFLESNCTLTAGLIHFLMLSFSSEFMWSQLVQFLENGYWSGVNMHFTNKHVSCTLVFVLVGIVKFLEKYAKACGFQCSVFEVRFEISCWFCIISRFGYVFFSSNIFVAPALNSLEENCLYNDHLFDSSSGTLTAILNR